MKPAYWIIVLDGQTLPRPYSQRAAANGAAMVFRGQGRDAKVIPVFSN